MNKLPDQPQQVDNSHMPRAGDLADSSTRNVKRYIFPFVVVLSVLIFLALLAAYNVLKPATCTVNGETYQAGDSFPAADGCNSCSCSENGEVSCTLIACIEEPADVDELDTSDWQTYRSEEYGFEFQYPPHWKYNELADPTLLKLHDQVWFTHITDTQVYHPSFGEPLPPLTLTISEKDPSPNWEVQYFDKYTTEAIMLGQEPVTKITATDSELGFTDTVVITKISGNYYLFLSTGKDDALDYFDQILSTFRFLDEMEVDKSILFEKIEGWGPCPPDSICRQTTTIYSSGEMVMEGEKTLSKMLSQGDLMFLKNGIRQSNIFNTICTESAIADYSASYIINLDGKTKTVRFPGCEQELKIIEERIPDL